MNPQAKSRPAQAIISQREFTACVDCCVSLLLAPAATGTQVAAPAPAQAQLRDWLGAGANALEDGTPIDFALFDSAILSVEERLPVTGSSGRTRLLRAARELAETIYAGVAPRAAAPT
ncbi:MAG: hypothetical protein ABI846_14250 [Rudaea sp.]